MNYFADKIYIHAKIHALRGSLLSKEQYSEIVKSRKFSSILPGTISEKEVPGLTALKNMIFRSQIEILIYLITINKWYSRFFKAFLLLFEVNNIKIILTRAFNRKNYILQLYDLTPFNIIDYNYMTEDIGLDNIRDFLSDRLFIDLNPDGEKIPDYETLENYIDQSIMKNLLTSFNVLMPENRIIFNNVMLNWIISQKIVQDLRIKKEYGSENDFMYERESPVKFLNIKNKDFLVIEKNIMKKIKIKFSGNKSELEKQEIPELEIFLNNLFMAFLKDNLSGNFHTLWPVITYAWMLYFQIINLLRIAEGFHYDLSPEMIEGRLITGDI